MSLFVGRGGCQEVCTHLIGKKGYPESKDVGIKGEGGLKSRTELCKHFIKDPSC